MSARPVKTRNYLFAIALLPLLASASPASADWSGGLEAGTQLGSGDSPTLRFYARDNGDPLTHYIYLDWTRESSGSSYRLGYNPVFNVSRSFYSFGKFSIEEDADSMVVDRQLDALIGLGNHIYRTRESLLTVEVGGGGQQFIFTDGSEDQTEGFLYLGARYFQNLFDTFRFNAMIDSRSGDTQDTVDAEVGLSMRLSATTALKYAIRYERTSFGEAGVDTITNKDGFFSLTYGF